MEGADQAGSTTALTGLYGIICTINMTILSSALLHKPRFTQIATEIRFVEITVLTVGNTHG